MSFDMQKVIIDERHRRILELIEPKKNLSILVIGTGFYPKIEHILFYEYGCKNITSGDIDRKNTENAKKALPQLKFIYLDAQKRFSFKDNTFDRVILTEVLEHLPDETIALNEIRRVLKPNGFLVLTVPRRRGFGIFSPVTLLSHKREYTKETASRVLVKHGFKVIKVFTGGAYFDLVQLWVHLIYKWVFGEVHLNNEGFLKKKIDESYRPNYRGKGTDVFVRASANKNK